MYLDGAAESWLLQTGRSTRNDWNALAESFKFEFCTPRTTPLERYHTMRQRTNEKPLQYLWRLNVAGRAAKILYHSPEGVRRHITRFVRTLTDSDVKMSCRGRVFATVDDLNDTLKTCRLSALALILTCCQLWNLPFLSDGRLCCIDFHRRTPH